MRTEILPKDERATFQAKQAIAAQTYDESEIVNIQKGEKIRLIYGDTHSDRIWGVLHQASLSPSASVPILFSASSVKALIDEYPNGLRAYDVTDWPMLGY